LSNGGTFLRGVAGFEAAVAAELSDVGNEERDAENGCVGTSSSVSSESVEDEESSSSLTYLRRAVKLRLERSRQVVPLIHGYSILLLWEMLPLFLYLLSLVLMVFISK